MHFLKSWRGLSTFSQAHNSLCRACGVDVKEHPAIVGFLNTSVKTHVSRADPSQRKGDGFDELLCPLLNYLLCKETWTAAWKWIESSPEGVNHSNR